MDVATDLLQHSPVDGESSRTRISKLVKASIVNFISGGVGATCSVYVGQPLDTVKVKLQTFPSLYNGMCDCFFKTFRNEGIRGLYAGTVPALVANAAEGSVLFASYGLCQKGIAYIANIDKVSELSSLQNATSGFFAAFFVSLVICPTELVKCRLQALNELGMKRDVVTNRITPWSLTQKILRTEGVPGLYRGLTSTFSREMPGYFFFFGGYESARVVLTPSGTSKEELSPIRTVLCGGFAGVTCWVSIFPTDVVKSRIQVAGSREPMLKLMLHIKRTEGIRALYNGLGTTVLRTFPVTGVMFLFYEMTKKYILSMTS